MQPTPETVLTLVLTLPAFVAALTVHEFAHAWMADRLGDDTARRQGRLTLDPLAHLDLFGSLMFVISQLHGFGFGWAKPVPFNPANMQHPRRDAMLVALAGPVSNLLQFPFWVLLLYICRLFVDRGTAPVAGDEISLATAALRMVGAGVAINMLLAAFNMIPIPPLDGHYVLEALGPPFIQDLYDAIRPYSFFVLLLIIQFTPLVSIAVGPFVMVAARIIFSVGGQEAWPWH